MSGRAVKPTTMAYGNDYMAVKCKADEPLSPDNLKALFNLCALFSDDPAEHVWLVTLAVSAGWTPERLRGRLEERQARREIEVLT